MIKTAVQEIQIRLISGYIRTIKSEILRISMGYGRMPRTYVHTCMVSLAVSIPHWLIIILWLVLLYYQSQVPFSYVAPFAVGILFVLTATIVRLINHLKIPTNSLKMK